MPKPATETTKRINAAFLEKLPFDCMDDFEAVRRGLIAETPDLVIRNEAGDVVWDMKSYYEIFARNADTPDTVNPSYWRHERKETVAGLFEVVDGIWQVRGYDIANLTLVRSDNGYIVIDALRSPAGARAAMELAYAHLPKKPVVAVIITHSHADHYNGLTGILSPEELKSGRIPIIVPDKFVEEVGNEGIFAGKAYQRRASYQFGHNLPKHESSQIGAGLGKTTTKDPITYVQPTAFVRETGETLTIDGLDIVFQMTPHAEAPAEFCLYIPKYKALCMAELANSHMHNLLPIRGAQARSAKMWAQYLQEALMLFGNEAEVLFITHHWPVWGNANIRHFLENQRDLYKFINDQTLRLMNLGKTMHEIAEELELPDSLGRDWNCRGYYGSLKHNAKATYQRYLGWYDCNPANLDPLPPEEAGRHYVEFMGGVEETLRKARESFDKGDYRWAAMVLNHLVFAHPEDQRGRELLADVYEQLGYQAECGTWRNSYMNAALELRQEKSKENKRPHLNKTSVGNMPTDLLLDYLAIQLDPQKADGKKESVNLVFTDTGEKWNWSLANSVTNCWPELRSDANASYELPRTVFDAIACGELTAQQALAAGTIKVQGEPEALDALLACLQDPADFSFGIVLP